MKKNIIITAGGTSEEIDSVRKITNFSTGSLGVCICNELLNHYSCNIEKIYYICSNTAQQPIHHDLIQIIQTSDVNSVEKVMMDLLCTKPIYGFIHCMAVSDYTTHYISNIQLLSEELANSIVEEVVFKSQCTTNNKNLPLNMNEINNEEIHQNIQNKIIAILENPQSTINTETKISSHQKDLFIKLKQTPKLIKIIKKLQPDICLIGFKLLNNVKEEALINVAKQLLDKNKCDIVVANDLKKISNKQHEAKIIYKDGHNITVNTKKEIAEKIGDYLFQYTINK